MRPAKFLSVSIIVLATFMACSHKPMPNKGIVNLTAAEVKGLIDSGKKPFILDVRTEEEYNGPLGKIEGSVLIPLNTLEQRVKELDPYKDRRIVIYCRSGNRSQVAARILIEHGFDVVNMEGGMKAWNEL